MSNDRQQVDRLESYLERSEQYDGSLDTATEQIVDSLHQAAQQTQPRPGFLNELAQQLEEERTMQHHSPSRMPRGLRLLLGGAALVATLAVVLYAITLFYSPDLEPSVAEMDSPVIIRRAESGPFAGQEIRVMEELPQSPGEAPQVQVRLQGVPTTIEEAKALASALGIIEPEVYQYANANASQHWVIMGRDGASLTLDPTQNDFAGFYYGHSTTNLIEGEPPPFEKAARTAEEILSSAGVLPDAYEIKDLPGLGGPGRRTVRFIPVVDGRPVVGQEAFIDAIISSDGQLTSLRVTPFTLEMTGESQNIKSAEDALQELLEGPATYYYSFSHVPGTEPVQIYRPQVERFNDGEEVTLTGHVNVLSSVESERVRAFMTSYEATTTVELIGPRTQELVDLRNDRGFEATGIIRKPSGSQQMQLEMSEWRQPESITALSSCRIGMLAREGASGVLEADDGTSLALDNLPNELEGDQRVEVCGLLLDSDGSVDWTFITVPPVSGTPAGSGGAVAGSAVSAVSEPAVEVTRVVTEEAGNEPQPAPTEAMRSSGSGIAVAPVPAHQPGEPLELGATVTLTGTVAGSVRTTGGERDLQLGLLVEEGDPLQPLTIYYPLVGDSEALEALATYYMLHVQIEGTVIQIDEEAGEQQGIQITDFSRLWPDEQIEAFLGHLESVELDGQELTLFTDEESGQEYILPQQWHAPLEKEQRVWVAGSIHPEHEIAGRPLLKPFSQRSGSDVDNATSAADIPLEIELPEINNSRPSGIPGLPGALVIERVVLGYSTSATAAAGGSQTETLLTPVWIFTGHTADGNQTFQIEIDATTGD